jgi:putative ABC transport system permease protein
VQELFGIPIDTLLVVLLCALGVVTGALAALAARNWILVRLGVRNARRRPGRSALIVAGLMLGTAIIAAALTTGDTMSHTIRQAAIKGLGETDLVIAARGATQDIQGELGQATGIGYFDEGVVERVESAVAGREVVDGVTGVIVEQAAVQAPRQRQSEPSVVVVAPDPERMDGFAPIEGPDGKAIPLGALEPGEIFLNEEAGEELLARPGDRVLLYTGEEPVTMRVREIVSFEGTVTADAALLMPLPEAQALTGRDGEVNAVFVSNQGGTLGGVDLSDEVAGLLRTELADLPLEVATLKQDILEDADVAGNAFMAIFTTFGTFSIAAGILLIFLIFVMLAAERRGELGIERAVGMRRSHVTQTFLFEGAAYDLAAAFVGAVLGAAIAYGMVIVLADAFGTSDADAGFQIEYAVSARSLAIAFALGVLVTLAVIAFSAWRVSMMTISNAIRNLPEPSRHRQRRRVVFGGAGFVLGVLLVVTGRGEATPVMIGVTLAIVSLVPILRRVGVPERIAYTSCGLAVVVILLLPWRAWEAVFGELRMDFSIWITSGLMIVVGTVWVIVYNADLFVGLVTRTLGRIRAAAPVLKMSLAYPLTSRFRTGATLAMFTLVVFTLVTGSASTSSFVAAAGDLEEFGGGFDVTAGTSGSVPIADVEAALRTTPGARPEDFDVVASQSVIGVEAVQEGTGREPAEYLARGLDDAFLARTTFGLGAVATGYSSAPEVWEAMRTEPGLAVVDQWIVPRRDNFSFSAEPLDFEVTGFLYEDRTFEPFRVTIADPQTGNTRAVTVVGVLEDTAPLEMAGITTSQETLEEAFPGRVEPTIHYFSVAPGVDPDAAAARLESAFLANGLEASSVRKNMEDATEISLTFNRVIQGFIGLGLIVGVAALGVISARSVVERRQQIGVLRAMGFRRGMVQATFLLEATSIAVSSILIGTILGLILAFNIIDDQRQQPSWSNLELVVPWGNLLLIFAIVYLVAIVATLAPAVRASRIRPAEALRYQ